MNLNAFIARGVALSGLQRRADAELAAQVEQARTRWLAALEVDELRTWMDVGQQSPEALNGLSYGLTLAALAAEHDEGPDCPAVRVIRGALRALEDCARHRKARITATDARALSVGVTHARDALKGASHRAIQVAAEKMAGLAREVLK